MISKGKHFFLKTYIFSFRKHFHFWFGNTFILQK